MVCGEMSGPDLCTGAGSREEEVRCAIDDDGYEMDKVPPCPCMHSNRFHVGIGENVRPIKNFFFQSVAWEFWSASELPDDLSAM